MEDPTCSLASEGVRVHSAMSSGPAVLLADDVYGDVVNVAARLVGLAGAGEILLSGKVYEGLPAGLRARVQLIDEMLLRNRPTAVIVYRYVADSRLATIRTAARRRASIAIMEVAYGDLLFVVGPERPRVTMGRDADNDIRIEDDAVSCNHAEITVVGDRFILVDRSTNGTYVYPDSGPCCASCVRNSSSPVLVVSPSASRRHRNRSCTALRLRDRRRRGRQSPWAADWKAGRYSLATLVRLPSSVRYARPRQFRL
jgi:hypothetical protein